MGLFLTIWFVIYVRTGYQNVSLAEDVKKGTQISTNKAFDRYLHVENEKMRKLYR